MNELPRIVAVVAFGAVYIAVAVLITLAWNGRRITRRTAVIDGVLVLVLLLPAAWVTVFLWPGDGDQYVPTLDALAVPVAWEAAYTEVVDGGSIIRERATRYYLVDADPRDSLPLVKQAAESAGFVVRPHVSHLGCNVPSSSSATEWSCGPVIQDECRSNGGQPESCLVEALRWFEEGERIERLWINLQPRGVGFYVGQGDDRRYVDDPDLGSVWITVDRVDRDEYRPLPSWPPAQ